MKVQVYAYDLTQGMASALSPMLLGYQIEAVWHTGVVIDGRQEIFFGYGIHKARAGSTMFGQPMQVLDMGETEVTHDVLDELLSDLAPRFRPQDYNLLFHNCNTFSNELVQLLTGESLPDYIMGQAQHLFNTPWGESLMPMIMAMEGFTAGATATGHTSQHHQQQQQQQQQQRQAGPSSSAAAATAAAAAARAAPAPAAAAAPAASASAATVAATTSAAAEAAAGSVHQAAATFTDSGSSPAGGPEFEKAEAAAASAAANAGMAAVARAAAQQAGQAAGPSSSSPGGQQGGSGFEAAVGSAGADAAAAAASKAAEGVAGLSLTADSRAVQQQDQQSG